MAVPPEPVQGTSLASNAADESVLGHNGPMASEPAGPPSETDWHDLAVWAELPEHRRELFGLRLDRWWPDLRDGLVAVYGAAAADELAGRLIRVAAIGYATREPDLARLDQVRTLAPDWFQAPS